jgi:hypothetical protein
MGAFIMYALADLFIWRKGFYDYLVAREKESQSWTLQDQMEYDELHASLPSMDWYYKWSPSVANVRMLFEFVLPVLLGLYAASSLLFRIWYPF